eukprot:5133632-Amphidinium_carterae.1
MLWLGKRNVIALSPRCLENVQRACIGIARKTSSNRYHLLQYGLIQSCSSVSQWLLEHLKHGCRQASAIGKNHVNAKSFLEKRYNSDMELEDAIHTAILTLKEGFEARADPLVYEGAITADNIEIGIVKEDRWERCSSCMSCGLQMQPSLSSCHCEEV